LSGECDDLRAISARADTAPVAAVANAVTSGCATGIDLPVSSMLLKQYIRFLGQVEMSLSHVRAFPSISLLPIYSGFQRGTARCSPLFFVPPCGRNSRVSAAKAMSLADNFRQKTAKTAGPDAV